MLRRSFCILVLASLLLMSLAGMVQASHQGNRGIAHARFALPTTEDAYVAARIEIPYDGIVGSISGLTYDHHGGFFWAHSDARTGAVERSVRLYKMRLRGGDVEILGIIPVVDENGEEFTADDIDLEDVCVGHDGTLWLVDEYGPWIIHLSREGRLIEKINPPQKYLERRRNGQGFEGVACGSDGRTIYAALQSNLAGDPEGKTYILAYDLQTRQFSEYVYWLDDKRTENYTVALNTVRMGISAMVEVAPGELVVIERDNMEGENARVKRIYRFRVPEQAGQAVEKELVLDLAVLGYDTEKAEGLAVPHPGEIAVINDNSQNAWEKQYMWVIRSHRGNR